MIGGGFDTTSRDEQVKHSRIRWDNMGYDWEAYDGMNTTWNGV